MKGRHVSAQGQQLRRRICRQWPISLHHGGDAHGAQRIRSGDQTLLEPAGAKAADRKPRARLLRHPPGIQAPRACRPISSSRRSWRISNGPTMPPSCPRPISRRGAPSPANLPGGFGNRRPISCGAVGVSFIARKLLAEVLVQSFNTPRGTIRVSSVEATRSIWSATRNASEGWIRRRPSLPNSPSASIRICLPRRRGPLQRLGYLLELVDAADKALPLMCGGAHATPRCSSAGPDDKAPRNDDWRLRINAAIEVEA